MHHNNHKIRTAVYVDGFNFYYWLKLSPYRWIDLKALALHAIAKPGKPACEGCPALSSS